MPAPEGRNGTGSESVSAAGVYHWGDSLSRETADAAHTCPGAEPGAAAAELGDAVSGSGGHSAPGGMMSPPIPSQFRRRIHTPPQSLPTSLQASRELASSPRILPQHMLRCLSQKDQVYLHNICMKFTRSCTCLRAGCPPTQVLSSA